MNKIDEKGTYINPKFTYIIRHLKDYDGTITNYYNKYTGLYVWRYVAIRRNAWNFEVILKGTLEEINEELCKKFYIEDVRQEKLKQLGI